MRTLTRLAAWVLFVLAFVTFVGAAIFAGGVGFLVPRTPGFELHLASPQELADAVGVSVLDPVSLA
ncbi:MAG: hypothetical protein H0U04_05475 [Rubrobacter sp.]|nr:hypothetical protein [Rubrobacter sp.]